LLKINGQEKKENSNFGSSSLENFVVSSTRKRGEKVWERAELMFSQNMGERMVELTRARPGLKGARNGGGKVPGQEGK